MINGKKVVERSVARKMVNKNLKVDSHIVKWWGYEDLWQGLCSDGLLFSHLSIISNAELNDFGFSALNIRFWKDIWYLNKE